MNAFEKKVKLYLETLGYEVLRNGYPDFMIRRLGRYNGLGCVEVKNRNENYVQLDFVYDRGTKNFEPDFRSIPEGALTYNPQDGLAYRNVNGEFIKLNPFTQKPIDAFDGTE